MEKQFTLSQVIQGYRLAASARHLSEHTIQDYENTFRRFVLHAGADTPINQIDHRCIENYLAGFANVTNKTLLNYHIALSALWTWATKEGLARVHVVREVIAPKPEKREIVPFTQAECKAMLAAIPRVHAYTRPGQRVQDRAALQSERNKAIFLMLLDTGLRASELCEMKLFQIDNRNCRVQVMGKGAVQRSVPFSPRTAQSLWRYLTTRGDEVPRDDPVFITSHRRAMDRNQLGNMLEIVGNRAGVAGVHPHRFRHTFAIQYLRNGGDPYTLQRLLGHSTLDMVRTYLSLAQIDLDKAHKRASPVDNWTL
jgi:integrase/recombinase XerD